MALPESKSAVLEDTTQALIDSGAEAEVVSEGNDEEFVDLNAAPEPAPKPAPAAAAPAKKPAAAAPAPAAEDDIPAELKGKTPAQLAKMYREAQSVIGRQGRELGELRQKADFAIKASLEALRARREPAAAPAAKPAESELDESEFFAKPKDAVSKMIENHPLIKKINETLGRSAADTAAARATAATERFNQTHPDAAEILQDAEFRKWVGASKVRTGLMQRAHQQFDFDAGDEVFSTWKALRNVKTASAAPASESAAETPTGTPTEAEVKAAASTLARAKGIKQAATQAAAQAAAVPTGGASAAKTGGGKKIYRRADVIQLMETDPDRYELLADEIALAYAENRVR